MNAQTLNYNRTSISKDSSADGTKLIDQRLQLLKKAIVYMLNTRSEMTVTLESTTRSNYLIKMGLTRREMMVSEDMEEKSIPEMISANFRLLFILGSHGHLMILLRQITTIMQ